MVHNRNKVAPFLLLIASITVIALPAVVESAKILCLFPTGSKSHVLGVQALLKHLAGRGHEVTMVIAFPLSKPVKNYRDVHVPMQGGFDSVMSELMQGGSRNMLKLMPTVVKVSMEYNNYTLNSPQFQQLVNEERFDLAIVGYFMNGFIVGIGALFKCPVIMYVSAGINSVVNVVGNPNEIASVPHLFLGNKNPMTFLDRVKNILIYVAETAFVTYTESVTKTYYNYNFPSEKGFPTYEQAKLNVSLLLCNSYFTQTVPRPLLPNVIEAGGLQIKPRPDPLPKDIQAWLDGADEHGAIFLSFGSNLKSSTLRQDKFEAIIGSLGKLKQRVIWKWDTDQMPGKPANVLIGKWLPQDDILAHKNLKLFITHGGLGSITESMYHGVPIVGIPMFGDQDTNVAQVIQEGWGESVSFDDLTEAYLTEAVERVLGNTKYAEKVRSIAKLYRDRPQSALDLATFWVEYVIRHKGATHLHYQGADLNGWQRNLLDVLVVLAVVLYVVLKIFVMLLRKLKKLLCGSKQRQKVKQN